MNVDVTIETHEKRPDWLIMEYDRFHEFDFNIPTSEIFLSGTSDYVGDFRKIKIAKGDYRVIVGFKGMETVSADGLEGEMKSNSCSKQPITPPTKDPTCQKAESKHCNQETGQCWQSITVVD